jgi:hypothetical protein
MGDREGAGQRAPPPPFRQGRGSTPRPAFIGRARTVDPLSGLMARLSSRGRRAALRYVAVA